LSVSDTLLVFVGIPAAVVLVIAGLAFAGNRGGGKRYRPGRPFDFTPVWFLSSPEQLAESAGVVLRSGAQAPALTSGAAASGEVEKVGPLLRVGVTGGASDRW
jgi:hypothetical protein